MISWIQATVKTKYLLQTADGRFLGNNQRLGDLAPAITDNIHLANTFVEGYPPFEMAEKYGKLLGVELTPMQMIPIGTGIFPKYELKPIFQTIAAGDQVFIKPEFQDEGDDQFIWQAIEDEDGGRVKIAPVNIGLPIIPNQIIETRMLVEAI